VRRDLERRLRAVEVADTRADGFELWIGQGDGTVRGPSGELLTCEELEARRRATGRFLFVISQTDARR
jgi:hypothetical protein